VPPDRSPVIRRANLRHAAGMLRLGRNPAATVYDSIGDDFFLALDDGWLNLGLWEGDGTDPTEAPQAVRRLVTHMAEALPRGGHVLDVGNGLGAQDPVIAQTVAPRSLTALNITLSQLRSGRERLAAAHARPVNGDACRMPFPGGTFDGVISVEAAFHFSSRAMFFAEAFRVLRPGGVLTISDVPVKRFPSTPGEVLAGVAMLRLWGIRAAAAATADEIASHARGAGFADVRTEVAGDRVIGPAFRAVRARLAAGEGDLARRLAARVMLREAEVLWDRGVLDYLFLTARKR
jgi:cyclopropane fatty-acyl-phospholipid synthase-like methyltransferase